MTQEEKQLLLKDLCARLPLGIKVQNIISKEVYNLTEMMHCLPTALVTNFRPYLRSLSSITEKEKKEAEELDLGYFDEGIYQKEDGDKIRYGGRTFQLIPHYETLDWLNQHHFDYRGLIEKGLALEAPEGMYNNM